MNSWCTLLLLALVSSGTAALVCSSSDKGYRLTTARGELHGTVSPTFPDVVVFSGIEYAIQPVGDLRFRHTSPVRSFPPQAGNYGKACPQSTQALTVDFTPYVHDEACLYFQFAVPRTALDAGVHVKRAIVTIHGGSFTSGSSVAPSIDFRRVASLDDVASFSFNYRLGVLGFVTDGDELNAGFHDQQLALEVIADVTAALGVTRTLLAGQSAGASSVAAHLLATSQGYDAAFLQSPPAGVRLTTTSEMGVRWVSMLARSLCFSASCMRKKPVEAVLAYQKDLLAILQLSLFDSRADVFGLMGLGPVQDGVVFTDNAVRQYNTGAGRHDIPVMVGSLEDEVLFSIRSVLKQPIATWMYPLISSLVVGPSRAHDVRQKYPFLAGEDDTRNPLQRLATDWAFGCGASSFRGDNVFSYFYIHPSSCSFRGDFCANQSCHAADLPVFYNSSSRACPEITREEMELGAQWRLRVWGMLEGEEPWAGGTGVEIGGVRDWRPLEYSRDLHACDYWDQIS